MSRVLLVVLALVALYSTCALSEEEKIPCKANEIFSYCANPCMEKCPGGTNRCTLNCLIGCECKEGFKRNTSGVCIPASQC